MIKHIANSLKVQRVCTDVGDDRVKYANKLEISHDRMGEVYQEVLKYAASFNNRLIDCERDGDDDYEEGSDVDDDDEDEEDDSSSYADASIKSDYDEDEEDDSQEMDDFIQDDDEPLEYYESSEEHKRKKLKQTDKRSDDEPVDIDLVDDESSSDNYNRKKRDRSVKYNDKPVLIDLLENSPPLLSLRTGVSYAKPTAINLSENFDNVRVMKKRRVDRYNG
jgi:hypothetical protein